MTRTSSDRMPTVLAALPAFKRGLRRRERRPLARSLEADAAGARPRHHVAFGVGDRHRRVVERGVDVRQPVMDDALLAALLERLLPLSRAPSFFSGVAPSGAASVFAMSFCSLSSNLKSEI